METKLRFDQLSTSRWPGGICGFIRPVQKSGLQDGLPVSRWCSRSRGCIARSFSVSA